MHLLGFLQARGLGLAAAVALGALVSPSQVGARVIEMAFGRHYHPIWTMEASVALVAGGVTLLLLGFPILALALALYGAGNGIGSIAKGTLPLALFGREGYASLMGRLAMPSLL
ncbi:MAG TPA: MFS transporter, partial [Microvirga sp.]|nr:MFS transporter [Microvirga sp.]